MVHVDKEKIIKKLDALKVLGNFKGKKEMRIRLEKQLLKINHVKIKPAPIKKGVRRQLANQKHSVFMKNRWNYTKTVWEKFPKIQSKTTKKQLFIDMWKEFKGIKTANHDIFRIYNT